MVLLAIWLSVTVLVPVPKDAPSRQVSSAQLFSFRSGFWINLHHFLYVLGRAHNSAPDSRREAVVKAPADIEGFAERPEAERAAWDASIRDYAGGLSTRDPVFDDGLIDITRKLAAAHDDADPATLGLPPELAATLKRAAPVYRAVWWPRHARANDARRADLQVLLDKYGAAGVKRLTALYETKWPAQPRVIDLVAYSNWAGVYSTTGSLIVFSSLDESITGPYGLEILLHESSHQWDEEIDRRLTSVAAKVGKPIPEDLSHAIIFYTTGEIVAELVPGHVPYAIKNGIWRRGQYPALKQLLDRYWQPYIRGTGTFEQAAAKLVEGG